MTLFRYLAIAFLVFAGCTDIALTGGTTDTGNSRILGTAVQADDTPVAGATVIIRKADYLSSTASFRKQSIYSKRETITDARGRYAFDSIDAGSYLIEINDRIASAAAVRAAMDSRSKIMDLGVDTLRPYAAVKGSVTLRTGTTGRTWVRIYGLERLVIADAQGAFIVPDLPDGMFDFIVTSEDPQFNAISTDSVKVVSGITVNLPFLSWKHSRDIVLNTSAAGAGVPVDVYNFPVLIRLTGGTFNFTEAQSNGQDLRFAKQDGSLLSYEAEQWDAAGQQAAIWVKIDTVHGSNAVQSITMHWGNPLAAATSNSASVFDTAKGFQGVWHMSQVGNTIAYDATANHFDGAPYNMTAASAVPGALGNAQYFDGSSSYIRIPGTASGKLDFAENGVYSISAWVYVDTFTNSFHLIAGKGHDQYSLKLTLNVWGAGEKWEIVNYLDKTGWQLCEDTSTRVNAWTLVTGVRNGNKQYLYTDGVLIDSTISLTSGTMARNTSEDVTIGRYLRFITYLASEGYSTFNGKIDEVRISNTALTSDWTRLCYMNQKALDQLVVFGAKK